MLGQLGFIEVAAVARVIQLGHPASAGTVLALWAAGSAAGGLIYGSKDWPGHAAGQLRVLLLVVAGGFAIVIAGQEMAWLYPLMFAAGLACAPASAALTTSFSMAGTTATRAASFAWLESSSSLGGSAGYAAAGLLLTHATITTTILIGAALPIAAATTVPQRTRRPDKPPGPARSSETADRTGLGRARPGPNNNNNHRDQAPPCDRFLGQ